MLDKNNSHVCPRCAEIHDGLVSEQEQQLLSFYRKVDKCDRIYILKVTQALSEYKCSPGRDLTR